MIPGMFDTLLFWTYIYVYGIPTLPIGCQAAVCSGRQKSGCGYPPSMG